MTIDPGVSTGELAARIRSEAGSGVWIALVVPAEMVDSALDAVHRAIAAGGTPMSPVWIDGSPNPLLHTARDEVLAVAGLETLSEADWVHLDLLRSRLERQQPSLLVMTQAAMEHLIRHAPNFASWFGGQFLSWDHAAETLSAAEKQARLKHLQATLGKTDEQVIEMAQSGQPLDEPAYAEWLVLLGRGDLLRQ